MTVAEWEDQHQQRLLVLERRVAADLDQLGMAARSDSERYHDPGLVRRVRDEYQGGATVADIARRHGRAWASIRWILGGLYVPPRRQKGKLTPEKVRMAITWHAEGMSHAKIAARLGSSKTTVGRYLKYQAEQR